MANMILMVCTKTNPEKDYKKGDLRHVPQKEVGMPKWKDWKVANGQANSPSDERPEEAVTAG